MSTTITYIQNSPSVPVILELVAKEKPLIQKMGHSSQFSKEEKSKIDEFFKQFSILSKTPEANREEITICLTFLICEVIHPASLRASEEQTAELIDFEESIQALLQPFLAHGETIDGLIDEYYAHQNRELIEKRKIEAVNALFQQRRKALFETANSLTEKAQSLLKNGVQAIQGLKNDTELKSEEMNDLLDKITHQIEKLNEKNEAVAQEIQLLDDRRISIQNSFQVKLDETIRLFKKV